MIVEYCDRCKHNKIQQPSPSLEFKNSEGKVFQYDLCALCAGKVERLLRLV